MKNHRMLLCIGIIEVLIGGMTLLMSFGTASLPLITKPLNVLCFIIVTSLTSITLGIGILRLNKKAYDLLIYFSSVIVLTKILIFMDIIELNGALGTYISSTLKDFISVMYHLAVILYLRKKDIKDLFYNNIPVETPIMLNEIPEAAIEIH